MKVPNNAYACAICQKTFNNPSILIKHVEFRHGNSNMEIEENEESFDEILAKLPLSQAEAAMEVFSEVFPHEIIGKVTPATPFNESQSPMSKIGSSLQEKEPVINGNGDPLEIPEDNSVTPFEFVPHIKVVDIVFKKESLQFETRNNDNSTAKSVSSTQNDVVVTQKETELNQKSSVIVKNMVNSQHQMNCKAPDELKKEDNLNNSTLETIAIKGKPEIFPGQEY